VGVVGWIGVGRHVAKRKRFDFEEKEECSLRYLGRLRKSQIDCCMTQMQALHRIKSNCTMPLSCIAL